MTFLTFPSSFLFTPKDLKFQKFYFFSSSYSKHESNKTSEENEEIMKSMVSLSLPLSGLLRCVSGLIFAIYLSRITQQGLTTKKYLYTPKIYFHKYSLFTFFLGCFICVSNKQRWEEYKNTSGEFHL